MLKLVAGIDDLGTGRQRLEGWSFFVVEEHLYESFSRRSDEILRGVAINSFHGKRI